jgi:endonuclease/exonuclease/phosphatase family metal-dependent hydrolase
MTRITVATINVHNRFDHWSKRRHLLVGQMVDAEPDLVSLQELSYPIGQGRWLRNQINVRLSGDSKRPYRLIEKRQRGLHQYTVGVGVLTKLPIIYHDTLSLKHGGRIALRVNVELPTRQSLDFVATHFHHPPYETEARHEQSMLLTGWLHSKRWVPYQIIAGDLNEVPDGLALKYIKQSFRSAFEHHHGYEPVATFPTALAASQVPTDDVTRVAWSGCKDYIFLSPGIRQVTNAAIFMDKSSDEDDTLYPSDHVGLITTFEL